MKKLVVSAVIASALGGCASSSRNPDELQQIGALQYSYGAPLMISGVATVASSGVAAVALSEQSHNGLPKETIETIVATSVVGVAVVFIGGSLLAAGSENYSMAREIRKCEKAPDTLQILNCVDFVTRYHKEN